MVVFGQIGFIWANWFYLGKLVLFEQKWFYSGKVVLFGQKVVVFEKK